MRLSQGNRPNISIGRHSINSVLNGVEYFTTDVRGWLDRPAVRQDTINRELADGEFPAPWQYEARLIDIDGYAFCKDWAEQHHISDQLNGLAATRREWLTIQGPGPMQSALVEAAGTPHFHMGINGVLEFGLRFKASDPLKYGNEHRVPLGYSNTSIGHMGNYPASPMVRMRTENAIDDFLSVRAVVSDVERVWRYEYPSNAGVTHTVDLARGKHFTGAAMSDVTQRVVRWETWQIPPHVLVPVRTRVDGTGDFTLSEVVYRDTWI